MPLRSVLPVIAVLAAFPANAEDEPRERPEALVRVLDCRAVAESSARLACYDREVAAMEKAEEARELVVVDRQQLRETRRSLFGLGLPRINIFGGRDEPDEIEDRIETTIRAARADPYGKYIFLLEDGAVWRQTDQRMLNIRPKPGHPIEIRRAAMGSYVANVNGQSAIRVTRDR